MRELFITLRIGHRSCKLVSLYAIVLRTTHVIFCNYGMIRTPMFLVTDEAGANPEKEHDVILATLVEH